MRWFKAIPDIANDNIIPKNNRLYLYAIFLTNLYFLPSLYFPLIINGFKSKNSLLWILQKKDEILKERHTLPYAVSESTAF